MGPAELSDLTGIDINYHVNKTFEQRLGERYKMHPLTELIYELVATAEKQARATWTTAAPSLYPTKRLYDVVQKYFSDNGVSPKKIADQR